MTDAPPYDAALVIHRLEEAGATLLALPARGLRPADARAAWPEVVHEAAEAYGYTGERLRPAVPSAAHITRMDEALRWVALIPPDRVVLRRIVGARSLVAPLTGRHLFSWRRLGEAVGADHRAVQRWHADGVGIIAHRLNALDQTAQKMRAFRT